MSLPRYPKYKDSGVEWFREAPFHWSVRRLKFVAQLVTDRAGQHTNPIALENVEGWTGRLLPTDSEFQGEGTAFNKRDILFGKLRPYLAKVYLAENAGQAVGDFHVLRPNSSVVYGRFLQYQMLSGGFISSVDGSTFGSKMPRASWEFVGSMNVAIPSLAEQEQIAAFLDFEIAKLDALVAEQERLIELLKEKRQAVISHAVTRGLNPNARMKESGVGWQGEVPSHWEELPLKALFAIKHGYPFDGEAFSDSGDYVVMTPGNFHERGGFRLKVPEKYYTGKDFPPEFILQSGQLLLAMTEQAPGLLGSALCVPEDMTYLHNQRLGLVHKIRSELISERYLFHVCNSTLFRTEVSLSSTGSKVKHTSPDRILSIKLLLPPICEQHEIANFIDGRTAELDAMEAAAEQSIELLQERRTALISAAVTGQIDVRSTVAPPTA